jgi:hypothetical protein
MLFLIPESPKYLIGKGRYLEAKQSLNQIAKINKVNTEIVS